MSERRPTILLADDHPMMLEGLRKLLEPEFQVAGTVTDGLALLKAAAALRPDLVITDVSMPYLDGVEATRRLLSDMPGMRVLILTIHTEPSWVRAAFTAGASGYLTKAAASQEIETAVREVLSGHFYISPAVTDAVVAAPAASASAPSENAAPTAGEGLTPRQLDIVRLVGRGLGNKAIAHNLGVSVTTVRTHLGKVYDKLGSATRVELALLAAQDAAALM
jgi:DNA-binding NarL/FixJ family response regulator